MTHLRLLEVMNLIQLFGQEVRKLLLVLVAPSGEGGSAILSKKKEAASVVS